MNLLGCDNENDAFNALAEIYQVDAGRIYSVAKGDWPEFLNNSSDSYQDIFNDKCLPILMASHLNASPNWNFGEVAYYHRTSYDGTSEWFQDGLLASIPAAFAFIKKVKKLAVIDENDVFLAIKNIEDRSSYEGVLAGGPYAFDVFDDAKFANRTGLDYSLPEFFIGCIWESKYGVPYARDLREALHNILKPVIVKFSAAPSDPDAYITNLWHYLFRIFREDPMDGLNHYPCTFQGVGKSIPVERIIQIIDL